MPIYLGPPRRESMASAAYELFIFQKSAMRVAPGLIANLLILLRFP